MLQSSLLGAVKLKTLKTFKMSVTTLTKYARRLLRCK